jgi:hypothetical protein
MMAASAIKPALPGKLRSRAPGCARITESGHEIHREPLPPQQHGKLRRWLVIIKCYGRDLRLSTGRYVGIL